MKAEARRKEIAAILLGADVPVSGSMLAQQTPHIKDMSSKMPL